MSNKTTKSVVSRRVESRIYIIRGKRVMLDRDLAALYGVTTGALNQAVTRNIQRFPSDFMFRLSRAEVRNLKSQFVILKLYSRRALPRVFTEQGVAMLSSVLNSEVAIQVNIQIIRTFVKLGELLMNNALFRQRMEALEKKYDKHDRHLKFIFEAIRKMMDTPAPAPHKRPIGFHT